MFRAVPGCVRPLSTSRWLRWWSIDCLGTGVLDERSPSRVRHAHWNPAASAARRLHRARPVCSVVYCICQRTLVNSGNFAAAGGIHERRICSLINASPPRAGQSFEVSPPAEGTGICCAESALTPPATPLSGRRTASSLRRPHVRRRAGCRGNCDQRWLGHHAFHPFGMDPCCAEGLSAPAVTKCAPRCRGRNSHHPRQLGPPMFSRMSVPLGKRTSPRPPTEPPASRVTAAGRDDRGGGDIGSKSPEPGLYCKR